MIILQRILGAGTAVLENDWNSTHLYITPINISVNLLDLARANK